MSVAHEHHDRWTVGAVLALPEDAGTRTELVGGALMMSPGPAVPHQRAARRPAALLENAAEAAGADVEILEAVNVVLPDGMLIPDIAVADASAAAEARLSLHAHDVLAVIEIASPSTRVADRTVKPALYAAGGITHYWRLESEPPRLHAGRLESGIYRDQVITPISGQVRFHEPFRSKSTSRHWSSAEPSTRRGRRAYGHRLRSWGVPGRKGGPPVPMSRWTGDTRAGR